MGKNRLSLILQLCVCLWLPVCQTECPYRECYCSGRVVSCTDRNLQALPQLVKTNASIQWSLALDGTNISRIPAGSLPPNITDIDVDESPLTTIDDTAFDASTTTLKWLFFSEVRFTQFPSAIGHLRALTDLSITGANITDWNNDAWRNIGASLTSLDLNNVGMTVWPSWFQYCTNLTQLTISLNAISSIPDGGLDSVAHSLSSLSLYNNRLTMVPKALSNLNSLQTLYLHDNQITDIRWLPQNSKLTMLSFSYNYIWNASQLSEVLRPYSTSLNAFDIDNNHLTSIPDISYLTSVRALQFTHNRISDPISGAVPSNLFMLDLYYNLLPYVPKMLSQLLVLTNIALANNAIRAIRDTDFHQNTSAIDLGYNLVTELTDTSFPENFGLQELHLNNNPLTTISTVAVQHLPNLTYLNLRFTKLTRLPLGLRYLKALVTIDVTNSASLVCTCMESSLTAWIVTLNPNSVIGNCGQTSVYDFFSILSHSCPASAETLS